MGLEHKLDNESDHTWWSAEGTAHTSVERTSKMKGSEIMLMCMVDISVEQTDEQSAQIYDQNLCGM